MTNEAGERGLKQRSPTGVEKGAAPAAPTVPKIRNGSSAVVGKGFAIPSVNGSSDGTSTRQHNEPAGNQDVWHYHVHLFPRYEGDALYASGRALMPVQDRARYAARLRAQLGDWQPTLEV